MHFEQITQMMPELAYVTIQTRNLIILLSLAPKLHDGAGEAIGLGEMPTSLGPKRNIVPAPITAEAVQPVTVKASELPTEQSLVLASSYQCATRRNMTKLTRIEEEDIHTPSDDDIVGIMTAESLYLRKGMTSFCSANGAIQKISLQLIPIVNWKFVLRRNRN